MPQSHKGTVTLWLAPTTVDRSSWSEYLEEHDGDDRRIPYRYDAEAAGDEPFAKSRFEADYSIWYDHDFVDGSFRKTAVDVARLLKPCSCSASFVDLAVAAAKAKRITESNAAVLIYDFGFDQSDADNQLAASRHSEVYNKRALLRFIASVPYVDSSKRSAAPAIDVAKKKRVALMRINRDHLETITSVDVWAVERDGEKLLIYRGKRVDKMAKTEKHYADVSKAKDAMKRMIDEKLEAGFQTDTWPRGGFKWKT
jgi:Immunity protein 22